MTTADLIAVMTAADRAGGLARGYHDRPRSEFVARFIGSSNILKGRNLDEDRIEFRGHALRCSGARLPSAEETAVSIRQHDIRLTAEGARRYGKCGPGHRRAPGLPGEQRDYIVQVADGRQLRVVTSAQDNIAQRSSVWLHLPPDRCRALDRFEADIMRRAMKNWSRRDVLKGASALGLAALGRPIEAAAPPAQTRDGRIDRGREERREDGLVTPRWTCRWPNGWRDPFEAKYPGVACRVERSGAERVFQRIGQEYASRIHAVAWSIRRRAHFIAWKRRRPARALRSEDVARHYPAEHKDRTDSFANLPRVAVRHRLQHQSREGRGRAQELRDLLDPRWTGRIVKAHPGYSGTIMTATFQIARDLGWGYFERLAKQRVMQVQSSADRPRSSRSVSGRSWRTATSTTCSS